MTGAVNFGSGGGGTALGWDTNNVDDSHGGPVEFSNNNRTITTGSIYDGAASTAVLPQTGKHYFELSFTDRNVILNISSTQAVSHWSGNTSELDNLYGFHIGNAGTYDASESDGLGDEMPNFNNIVNPHINSNPGPYLWGFAYDADAGTFSIYFENMLMYTINGIPTHDYYIHLTSIAANNPITINFAESDFVGNVPTGFASLESGGGGAASVIGVDGSASFGGNVTASTVPTDDAHLVNKLYADSLVAGVDLSGIATNAAAISAEATTRANADTAETNARTSADTALSGRLDTLEADPTTQTLLDAETTARQDADALKLDLAGGTVTGNITASAVPSDDAHLVNKLYADNLVAGVDLSGIATNASAIAALTNGAPELLNTLNELAEAIGDDENFATTVTNQISTESTARTNADTALSGRLDTLEADPTTGAALTAEATTRANADTALSGRLDTLEADPTTQTLLDAETSARIAADTAETNARTSADTALSGRLDTLEADPTTGAALTAETNARTSADTALSNRLDTLEADPTTQTLLAAETAARQAADTAEATARTAGDALKLDLAGGTMTGDINLGAGETVTTSTNTGGDRNVWGPNNGEPITQVVVSSQNPGSDRPRVSKMANGASLGYSDITDSTGWQIISSTGAFEAGNGPENLFDGNQYSYVVPSENGATLTIIPPAPITTGLMVKGGGNESMAFHQGGGSGASVLGVDGTATFGGAVSASTVPTADAHLVNKLYADNLVAGVDLSGIATNAAAIEALTNGAPELLNTLAEIGDALGDDENFATTITGQISAETTARTNADNALSGRLDTLEADPTTQSALTAETVARINSDNALSGRLDTLEADPTTATALASETTARTNADNALSGRLDTLEADSTTQSLLDAETTARTNADTALSGRLNTLEADPTTASALASEATTRANADTALSGRLDTLEADPTTATSVTNAIAVETAARQAADALLLPLAGGLMTGSLELGVAASTTSTAVFNTTFNNNWTYSNNNLTATNSGNSARTTRIDTALPSSGKVYVELSRAGLATFGLQQGWHIPPLGEIKSLIETDGSYGPGYAYEIGTGNVIRYQGVTTTISQLATLDANDSTARVYGLAIDIDANKAYMSINGSDFYELTGWFNGVHPEKDATSGGNGWFVGVNGTGDFSLTLSAADWTHQPPSSDYQMIGGGAGGGSVTTVAVDGTATFGGAVSASTVPTADAHLVNKLYADNLVAGVDLSGIATNAAAIQALTNGAPELLNTLQELASALGDDANFSTTVTGQIAANEVHIDNAATLSGVAKDSTSLGAFTGSTISDTSNIKAALQALETAIETPSAASQIQTIEQTANGTFHVTFVDSNNGSATAESLFTDSGLTYNPSTDLLSGGSIDMTTLLLDGVEVTATGAELNFLGGLTSGVQTQLDGKVTTGANISALVGDTTAGDVPVDVNGTDNYLFLVIDKANGALTAIDKTFLEAE